MALNCQSERTNHDLLLANTVTGTCGEWLKALSPVICKFRITKPPLRNKVIRLRPVIRVVEQRPLPNLNNGLN